MRTRHNFFSQNASNEEVDEKTKTRTQRKKMTHTCDDPKKKHFSVNCFSSKKKNKKNPLELHLFVYYTAEGERLSYVALRTRTCPSLSHTMILRWCFLACFLCVDLFLSIHVYAVAYATLPLTVCVCRMCIIIFSWIMYAFSCFFCILLHCLAISKRTAENIFLCWTEGKKWLPRFCGMY